MPIINIKPCRNCNKEFTGFQKKVFCSHMCRLIKGISELTRKKLSDANKGKVPWIKGKKLSKESRLKMSRAKTGTRSSVWKGEKAGYGSKHQWVVRYRGKAKECENCGKKRKDGMIHWSNIDHKYRRVLSDYQSLCVRCHKHFDLSNGLCNH